MQLDGKAVRLIDAHCHLNFNAYKNDAEAVIRRSLDAGIGLIVVGSQSATSAAAAALAAGHDGLRAIVGLHPIHLFEQKFEDEEEALHGRREDFDSAFYRRLVRDNPRVVALGECGIDYHHMPPDVPTDEAKAKQEAVFRGHLDLALELDLPVMVHCRDAHEDVIRILSEYAAAGRAVRGDMHCFSGGWAEAERYLRLGLHISFTGNLTYPPRKSDLAAGRETLQDVARRAPLDRILVETYAPYLSPVPHRGERNEPAYVAAVAAKIAELKGLPVEEVERQTLENTARLFRLK